jgi:hypothetical protein
VIAWLGLFFGWCARERVRADGPWAQPAISLVLVFVGIVLAPCGLYFYLVHPAWAWLYLVDASKVPRFVAITVVVAQAGALILGYYGAAKLVRSGRELILRFALPGAASVWLLLAILLRGRIGIYGSYAAFKEGYARPLMDVKLGYVLIAVVVGAGAAAAVVAYELSRDSKRAAAR